MMGRSGPLPNLRTDISLFTATTRASPSRLAAYWPGDDLVDVCGFDPYPPKPTDLLSRWLPLTQCLAFAEAKGKPVMLCETAPCNEDLGAPTAAWIGITTTSLLVAGKIAAREDIPARSGWDPLVATEVGVG